MINDLLNDALSADEKKELILSVAPADITGDFLADCAQTLLSHALPLPLDGLDVCGTGGDSKSAVKVFNVSTAVAFVVAAADVPIIKHGNRAVSGTSGSSDVLAALNIPISTETDSAKQQFQKHGLCFVSAPAFHPVLKKLADIRKSIGRPTFLNLLGPLCNPARTKQQIIGVFHKDYLYPMAAAAQKLGKESVLIVHSRDGLDEISTAAETDAVELKNGVLSTRTIAPEEAGLPRTPLSSIACTSADDSAKIILDIFSNHRDGDILLLNAAHAFVVAGKDATIKNGVARAREMIQSGRAIRKLTAMQGSSA